MQDIFFTQSLLLLFPKIFGFVMEPTNYGQEKAKLTCVVIGAIKKLIASVSKINGKEINGDYNAIRRKKERTHTSHHSLFIACHPGLIGGQAGQVWVEVCRNSLGPGKMVVGRSYKKACSGIQDSLVTISSFITRTKSSWSTFNMRVGIQVGPTSPNKYHRKRNVQFLPRRVRKR